MSTKKNLELLAPCFGEAFVDDFFFSSMFSTSMNYEDTTWLRQEKDYVHVEFIEEDLIKSKFWAVKNHKDGTTTPSSNTNRSSVKKTWGWSEVKYQAEEHEPVTPFAK